MIAEIADFATTTVSLVFFCILGVAGQIDDIQVYEDSIAFETQLFSVSIGGFIAGPRDRWAHEYGHVLQQRQLGAMYLPIIAVPSLFFNMLGRLGYIDYDQYHSTFPEKWADQLGGYEY